MILYKHKEVKGFLKLKKLGKRGVNVFDHVNEFGTPTYKKRPWSVGPQTQVFIVTGWDKLTPVKARRYI